MSEVTAADWLRRPDRYAFSGAMLFGVAALIGLILRNSLIWAILPSTGLIIWSVTMLRRELRSTELRLQRAILEKSDLLEFPTQTLIITDGSGRIVHLGSSWQEWTGMDLERARKGRLTDALHPNDQAVAIASWANARDSGVDYDQEYRVRFRSGRYRWVRCRAYPRRMEDGQIRAWIAVLEDVHERRIAEEQLRQTASLLEMIGTSTDSMIYAKDHEGKLLYANRAVEQMAGMSLAEILGKTDSEWHPNPIEAEAFRAADRQVIASGRSQDVEEVFTSRSGAPRFYRSLKSPLRDRSGKVIGVVGVSTDVTDKRESELREQLLTRELEHRAKNLLTVVQSVVSLTAADTVDEFKAAAAGRIQALCRTHSLLSAGKWEGADLHRILSEELASSEPEIKGGTHFAGPPLMLKPAVAQSLALVFHEFATNAARHGSLRSEGGELHVTWHMGNEHGQPTLNVRWEERNGSPLPASGDKDEDGFGLRLIRNSIERQLGGKLHLELSEHGLRASFSILLDRSLAPSISTGRQQATSARATSLTRRARREQAAA